MDTGTASVKTALNISHMWATFAATGKPGATGQPARLPYDTTRRATMLINADCKVVDDPFGLERTLWERLSSPHEPRNFSGRIFRLRWSGFRPNSKFGRITE